jgi:hypothetical protein
VGVFLNEKQMGRLVHSIGQQQLQHISILRLEQLLMDMEETTCKIHLSVRPHLRRLQPGAPHSRFVLDPRAVTAGR